MISLGVKLVTSKDEARPVTSSVLTWTGLISLALTDLKSLLLNLFPEMLPGPDGEFLNGGFIHYVCPRLFFNWGKTCKISSIDVLLNHFRIGINRPSATKGS